MSHRKNVVVFYTDQQRADSLGCMGNPLARTGNIDALAARGVLYRNHYATNPVCMPSRASFITGRHLQAHGVVDNGVWLPETELTMPEVFRQNGYRTAAFGKLHFQTFHPFEGDMSMESMGRWSRGELDGWSGPYYGFEHVALTSAHGEHCTGHYGRWRRRNFPDLKLGIENAQGGETYPEFGSYKSNLPEQAHYNTWVADRAIEFLDRAGDEPFYIHVSFPDPHHPFTPPAPYHSMFDGVEFPPPHAVPGENDTKPKPYQDAMAACPFPTDGGARRFPDFTGKAYQQVVAHTYGMIAMIDGCVGRVLAKLDEKGLSENTLVVFTSDHGDFLGDHHLLFKGQLPCRSLLHVPLIVACPGCKPGVVEAVSSNVDVMPTLLSECGIDVPETVQGVPLPTPGGTLLRDYAFAAGWSKASPHYHHYCLYKRDWRISVFPNLREGELYDLNEDPFEHRNLFHDMSCRHVRDRLVGELLNAVGAAEPKKPPAVTNW